MVGKLRLGICLFRIRFIIVDGHLTWNSECITQFFECGVRIPCGFIRVLYLSMIIYTIYGIFVFHCQYKIVMFNIAVFPCAFQ